MEAIWVDDYDWRSDKIYKAVGCPSCKEALLIDDDKYWCPSCGEHVEVVDKDMVEWFDKRKETKTEYSDCFLGCGGKGTVETHYMRNPNTLKWQVMGGVCKQCGQRFIV